MVKYSKGGCGEHKMRIEEFLLEKPVFTSKDFASSLSLREDSASRKLSSLNQNGILAKAGKGLWFNSKHPKFSLISLVPLILGCERGYVSFISALNYHGVTSQIPQKIFVATTGHARKLKVDNHVFELIQIKPEFMQFGIEWKGEFAMACAEKALIDCLYVSSRKGKRFYHMSEIDLSALSPTKLKKLLKQHPFSKPISTFVNKRIVEISSLHYS